MTEEAKARKPRKPMKDIELYSVEGNTLVKLDMEVPQDLKSTEALVRWLKANAQIDGKYLFVRPIAGVNITTVQTKTVQSEMF